MGNQVSKVFTLFFWSTENEVFTSPVPVVDVEADFHQEGGNPDQELCIYEWANNNADSENDVFQEAVEEIFQGELEVPETDMHHEIGNPEDEMCTDDLTATSNNMDTDRDTEEIIEVELKPGLQLEVQIESTFICRLCNTQCCSSEGLDEHFATHTKVILYYCSLCNVTFNDELALKWHLFNLRHPKLSPYVCKECNRPFRYKKDLLRHIVTHTGVFNFVCHLCQNRFNRRDNLSRHMARKHLVYSPKKVISNGWRKKKVVTAPQIKHEEGIYQLFSIGLKKQ